MQIDIAAPHFTLTNALRDYIERRFGPLERFHRALTRTTVVLDWIAWRGPHAFVVRAHANLPGETADVEARGEELYAAIDAAVDKLGARVRKTHDRACQRH
jgi:ribosomal subunit interface protein